MIMNGISGKEKELVFIEHLYVEYVRYFKAVLLVWVWKVVVLLASVLAPPTLEGPFVFCYSTLLASSTSYSGTHPCNRT